MMPGPGDALVQEAASSVGRDDLLLDVASPDGYAEIERLSHAAPAGEMTSPLTASLLAWFIDDNPAGRGFVVVARDPGDGAPVGHFVFYPWRLLRRPVPGAPPGPHTVHLFVRLYVAPAWRRRGVFSAMTRFGLAVVEGLGGRMAYTAPNPRSAAGFVKFGMDRRGPLPFWVRPAARAWDWAGGAGGRRTEAVLVQRVDDDLPTPAADTLPSGTVAWSVRDAATLHWRYVRRPDVSYAIRELRQAGTRVGYLVTRRMRIGGREVLAVCDAWTVPGHEPALRAGVRAALAAEPGARLVLAIGGSASPEYARACRRAGFLRCPTPLLPQPVEIYGTPVGARAPVDLPALNTWHLTPYDWDVF